MKATFIQECIDNNVEITLTIKANDLIELFQYSIDKAARETAEQKQLKDAEVYYSVDEVMEVLNIKNRSTIWRWQKSGYLTVNKVGKLCRYKKSDIDMILNSGSTK